MSLKLKLLLTLVPILVVAVVIGRIVQMDLATNSKDLMSAIKLEQQASQLVPLVMIQVDSAKTLMVNIDLLEDVSMQRIEAYEQLEEAIDELTAKSTNATIKDLAQELLQVNQEVFEPAVSGLIENLFESQEIALAYYSDKFVPAETAFRGSVDKLALALKENVSNQKLLYESKNQQSLYKISACLLAMIFLCGIFIMLVAWKTSRVLEGEIAALSEQAHNLADSSQELVLRSDVGMRNSEANLELIDQNIQSLNDCEQISTDAKGNTQSSRSALATIIQQVENGNQQISTLQDSFTLLKQSQQDLMILDQIFKEIEEDAKEIDEIVFNTKLLSFNASVEAERAGEFGRGFSVVAAEVGRLATQSGGASGRIKERLKTHRKSVMDIVEVMTKRITSTTESSEETLDTFHTISDSIKQIDQVSDLILEGSQSQLSAIQKIVQGMSELHDTAQAALDTSRSHTQLANSLTEGVQNLEQTKHNLWVISKGKPKQSSQTDHPADDEAHEDDETISSETNEAA